MTAINEAEKGDSGSFVLDRNERCMDCLVDMILARMASDNCLTLCISPASKA